MVYPGQPSRGCETCRARKVKCDETRPTCLRCAKAKRVCGGYRMLSDTRKPQKSSVLLMRLSMPSSTSPGNTSSLTPIQDYLKSPLVRDELVSLSSCSSAALGRVKVHNILSRLIDCPQVISIYDGCLTCLPVLFPNLKRSTPILPALAAYLLAFVSHREYGNQVQTQAVQSYVRALALMRQVAGQTHPSRKNEIIGTILLLSMYEEFSSLGSDQSVLNSHIRGAMAFVQSQPLDDFEDPINRKLCTALLNRCMYSCIHHRQPSLSRDRFPFTIHRLRALHDSLIQERAVNPRSSLHPVTCRLVSLYLRSTMVEEESVGLFHETATKINSIINAINAVEVQLSRWPHSLPPEWKYETTKLLSEDNDTLDAWTTTALTYPAFWVANDWAHYRALSIFTHSLQLRCYRLLRTMYSLVPGLDSLSTLAELSANIESIHIKISHFVDEICASVPYHLGYHRTGTNETLYPREGFPPGKYPRLISACHVLWPLYVAGVAEGRKISAQTMWIAQQLDNMGKEMGIRQASVLATEVVKVAMERTEYVEPL
ncbi:hypothetical protein BDV26DRAFT_296619 [Aspergillus bertholletiae]|uniref:Zn(2)-C6 fungal-type domain-containing protein n=1 Tax=Aspergillus bertholletiae TaxID=1226010 RepID=A0A5N7AVD4_9EURO|nr:hypothetical protein BDV26DRAFT_296619 [Aspergillus bertholletiae]